jgi:hypothetical protein
LRQDTKDIESKHDDESKGTDVEDDDGFVIVTRKRKQRSSAVNETAKRKDVSKAILSKQSS